LTLGLSSLPSSAELRALARKYETLARLRRDRDRDGTLAARAVLRALAREFPGALRELDTVGLDEIDRRERILKDAASGGTVEAWMTWMVAYHATMRAALLVKARVARSASLSDDVAREAAADASRLSGWVVDEAFVRTMACPPHGRLNVAVFQRLGDEFRVAPDVIWEALFPARRAGRY
jgi:hypothetical protein